MDRYSDQSVWSPAVVKCDEINLYFSIVFRVVLISFVQKLIWGLGFDWGNFKFKRKVKFGILFKFNVKESFKSCLLKEIGIYGLIVFDLWLIGSTPPEQRAKRQEADRTFFLVYRPNRKKSTGPTLYFFFLT